MFAHKSGQSQQTQTSQSTNQKVANIKVQPMPSAEKYQDWFTDCICLLFFEKRLLSCSHRRSEPGFASNRKLKIRFVLYTVFILSGFNLYASLAIMDRSTTEKPWQSKSLNSLLKSQQEDERSYFTEKLCLVHPLVG